MKTTIDIKAFTDRFNIEYEFLYDHRDNVAGYDEAVDAFDEFLKDPDRAAFVGTFAAYRQDMVTSDREAAAFMFALEAMT